MRALFVFFLVFGAVAVAYAVHWSRRAVDATIEASTLLQQSGSITETARRLFAHEMTPHEIRLTSAQTAFLDQNIEEFSRVYGALLKTWVEKTVASDAERLAAHDISPSEFKVAQDAAIEYYSRKFGKEWCDLCGVR
ncbi:MAG: hypothetical protein ABIO35_08470 [Nitrobacter sp.]